MKPTCAPLCLSTSEEPTAANSENETPHDYARSFSSLFCFRRQGRLFDQHGVCNWIGMQLAVWSFSGTGPWSLSGSAGVR